MIVGKIWDFEYPWDVRVEKVAAALLSAGHQVHLFCRNRKGEPEREQVSGMEVHRMPSWRNVSGPLEDVTSFPAFLNPRWIGHVMRSARQAEVDLLLCRDLPLAPLALHVGKRLGVPVVVDIAENYPAMLKHRFHWRDFRPHNLLVRNPLLAALVERYVVARADGLLVVVEESMDRFLRMGVPAERMEIVGNTPTEERIQAMRGVASAQGGKGPLRLVYLGLLGRSRGVEVVLEALALLRNAGLEVHFDVIGSDREGVNLRKISRRLGLENQVFLHGYVPYDRALGIVAAADVGIVPHHATEHWNTTIPNKLFDYMAAGLPVLVSDAPPTKRVVTETGAGLVFRDRDPEDLARQIRRIASEDQRHRMGVAGREAVQRRYHWRQDAERLLHFVEAIAESRCPVKECNRREPMVAAGSRDASRGACTSDLR